MTFQHHLKGVLVTMLAAGFLPTAVQAQESPAPVVKTSSGTIVGIVTNRAKQAPIERRQVPSLQIILPPPQTCALHNSDLNGTTTKQTSQ